MTMKMSDYDKEFPVVSENGGCISCGKPCTAKNEYVTDIESGISGYICFDCDGE